MKLRKFLLPGVPLHSTDIRPPQHTRPETLTSPSTGIIIHYSIAMHVKKAFKQLAKCLYGNWLHVVDIVTEAWEMA